MSDSIMSQVSMFVDLGDLRPALRVFFPWSKLRDALDYSVSPASKYFVLIYKPYNILYSNFYYEITAIRSRVDHFRFVIKEPEVNATSSHDIFLQNSKYNQVQVSTKIVK